MLCEISVRKTNHWYLSFAPRRYLLVVRWTLTKRVGRETLRFFEDLQKPECQHHSSVLVRQRGMFWISSPNRSRRRWRGKLASAILTRTMEQHLRLVSYSYDRLFPSQDTMPKADFGISLLTLATASGKGEQRLCDDQLFRSYDDQWAYISRLSN